MYVVGFPGIPDLIVWPERSSNILLWVKFRMAAICQVNGQTKFVSNNCFIILDRIKGDS